MTAWTIYWKKTTAQAVASHGKQLDHVAGNLFQDRGMVAGDRLFVVTFWNGVLKLVGALTVQQIADQSTAERLLRKRLWRAKDHAIARKGSTAKTALRDLPQDVLQRIEFIYQDGSVGGVKYNHRGEVEPQTFRTEARVISIETAKSFERQLAHEIAGDEGSRTSGETGQDVDSAAVENMRRELKILNRSRNRGLRDRVIRASGGVCAVCGRNYAEMESRWSSLLQAHHRTPLHLFDKPVVTKDGDLAAVCPTCHRLLHLGNSGARSLATVKRSYKRLRIH